VKPQQNLNVVQPKLFKLLVKMIAASPLHGVVIKFLTMQMEPFRPSWRANCGTFLSATTMYAEQPHRSDDLASSIASRLSATASGYRAAI